MGQIRDSYNTIEMLFGLLKCGGKNTKSECGLSDWIVQIKLHLILVTLLEILPVLTLTI